MVSALVLETSRVGSIPTFLTKFMWKAASMIVLSAAFDALILAAVIKCMIGREKYKPVGKF